MPIKIFTAQGEQPIAKLEGKINAWFEQRSSAVRGIRQISTAINEGDEGQTIVVTVLYDERDHTDRIEAAKLAATNGLSPALRQQRVG